MNNSRLPDCLELLAQPAPNNDDEPYMDDEQWLIDPWGNSYDYKQMSSRKFLITCFGADGLPGGEGVDADITSRPPR